MALLPIESERLDEALMKTCTNLIAAHLNQVPNHSLITADDIKAMLSHEHQKAILNCEDDSCIAQIGGALGVDELIRVSLGKLGSKLVISMARLDVAKAAVSKRTTVQIDNLEDYYNYGFARAVADVFGLEPPPAPEPRPAPAQTAVQLEGQGGTMGRNLALTMGTAAIGLGAYFGLQAEKSAENARALETGSHHAAADAKQEQWMANIFYGVGAAGLITGFYLWLSEGSAPPAQGTYQKRPATHVVFTDFAVVPIQGGAHLSLGGQF